MAVRFRAVAWLRGERWPAGMVGSAPASRRSCTTGGEGEGRIGIMAGDGVDGGLDGGLLEEEGHDVGVREDDGSGGVVAWGLGFVWRRSKEGERVRDTIEMPSRFFEQ